LATHLVSLLAIGQDCLQHRLIAIASSASTQEIHKVIHQELHPTLTRLMLCNHFVVLGAKSLLLEVLLVGVKAKLILLIFQSFDSRMQLLLVFLDTLHVTIQLSNELLLLLLINRNLLFQLFGGQTQSSQLGMKVLALST
jgi:hypothetical protein